MDWIISDGRRRETAIWAKWLGQVPRIRRSFGKAINDDPMLYNETASVGVLAGAANKAGLLALSEYVAIKRGKGRGRPHRNGRCDLWVADPVTDLSWAFEFKQLFCRANPEPRTLAAALARACEDADSVHPFEADRRFGAVLLSARENCALSEKTVSSITELALETTFACCLKGGIAPIYLLMKELR